MAKLPIMITHNYGHTKDSVVVAACMALTMKHEPQNISGRPGVSIM